MIYGTLRIRNNKYYFLFGKDYFKPRKYKYILLSMIFISGNIGKIKENRRNFFYFKSKKI